MAGSASLFPAGPSQTDGTSYSTGRGRAFHGQSAPNPSKTVHASRTGASRGRARSGLPATRPGRSRGQASNTWRRKTESSAAKETADSPFAQLKQNSSSHSIPNGQPPQNAAVEKSERHRVPTTLGKTTVHPSQDPRKRIAPKPINETSQVPVEDASILSWYNSRFEQLKVDRMKERETAIKKGLMADPNQPTHLNQAIRPVGTCTSMCPEFERVERIVQKMVDKSEKFLHPLTNSLQYMETKMLKRFRRSAAGYDEQLPSDIRTPKTLLQTTNYLIRHVIGGPEPLGVIHKFVWDRTRSIRNDFSVQQLTQEDHVRIAATCLERIARFHIVSLHLLSSPTNREQFDRHQEREQLNNTMLSLMYYYDDNRGRITFPNEDEFRAYYIILSIHDQRPDLEARVQKWPAKILSSPRVQIALELYAAASNTWEYQGALDARRQNPIAQGFYNRFFSFVISPCVSYLMACVAEIYFNHVRQTAIRSIWRGYCRFPPSQQHKNDEWTVDELTAVLHFDDNSQTINFCKEQDLELVENGDGELYLNWGSRHVDSVAFQPSSEHGYSEKSVESKRAGRSLVAVILGLNIQEAISLGMVDTSFLSKRTPLEPVSETSGESESIFVSEDEGYGPQPDAPRDGSVSSAVSLGDKADSASNIQYGSEKSAHLPDSSKLLAEADSSTAALQKPGPSKSPGPLKKFSSLFAAGTANLSNPFAASNTVVSNPFAVHSAALDTHKPEAPNNVIGASPTTTASLLAATAFSTSNSLQPAGKEADMMRPTLESMAPQFKLSTFSRELPAPAPASHPAGTHSNESTSFRSSIPTSNVFDSSKPLSFPASSLSFGPPDQNATTNVAAMAVKSVDRSAVTDSPSRAVTCEGEAKERERRPTQPAQGSPPSPYSSSTSNMLAVQEEKEISSIFGASATPMTAPLGPMVSDTKAIIEPETKTTSFHLRQITPRETTITQTQAQDALRPVTSFALEQAAFRRSDTEQSGSLRAVLEDASPFSISPSAVVPKEPALVAENPPLPQAENEAVGGGSAEVDGSGDQVQAWVDMLQEAAAKRRQETSSHRKRVRGEKLEKEPEGSECRTPKMPKPDKNIRPTSLALTSIKPLPKLPILEQVESTIARKSTVIEQAERAKRSQVDEDELLLSAARIAAESLRRGPRLFDDMAISYEMSHSLLSTRRGLPSSLSALRSGSLQSDINEYNVAYAPDTNLGLGRTMSRTEQRIRMTGGKGLAYKPLDFTPQKVRKEKGKKKEKK